MMGFVGNAAVLLLVSAGLVTMIRKNLAQRELSRKLREIFIQEASDLVAKADFPAAHARLFIGMSSLPEGWATRLHVSYLFAELIGISKKRSRADAPSVEQVPAHLRKKFVVAMLAFALSDSYRAVIFGHIFRATNRWITDAVREPQTDVEAHATRNVIEKVVQVQARKSVNHDEFAHA